MDDSLVIFETAKLAKNKGFNVLCYAWFYIYPKGTQNPRKHWKIISILEEDEIHELVGGQHGKTINEKYSNSIDQPHILARPTQSLLQKWLREVHKIDIDILTSPLGYSINIWKDKKLIISSILIAKYYKEFEQALEVGLYEALKLIENK